MTTHYGYVIHANGWFDQPPSGWKGARNTNSRIDQILTSHTEWPENENTSPQFGPPSQTKLDDLHTAVQTTPDKIRLDRVDLIWWANGPLPTDTDIDRWITQADPDHLPIPTNPTTTSNDRWPTTTTWPGGWHPITRSDHLALTCTIESRSPLRIWLICSTHPYLNPDTGDHHLSISGIVEQSDRISGQLGCPRKRCQPVLESVGV